ncbi:MAG: TrkH family potassium uptake protein, partial [Spirochaetales bacterium]|nr:TrkH family potassium uptake protein [Spirochaetales bacterium]
MKIKIVLHVLSVILLIISLFILLSAFVSLRYKETESAFAFFKTLAVVVPFAIVVYFATRSGKDNVLGTREGFLLVTASWIAASLAGALPFVFAGAIPAYTDAFFETMSGFTTTGASILTDIEGLSHGMLFWRSLTHWLGGMGIVVLTVALLPLLGIGGIQLLRAEAPGPSMDKITPKITQTAKILWLIYVGFTVIEIILLMIGGMSLFDASTHTFGTMATGGFSTKASSVGAFDSAYIHIVITVFMVLAGMNFNLFYKVISGNFKGFFKDTEMRVYLSIFLLISVLISIDLMGTYGSFGKSLQYASFQTASILTTTGYASTDFALWPAFSKNALFFIMFVGGCSGSTGGGIKVVRIVTLIKLAFNEMKQMVYPRGVFPLRMNGTIMKKEIVYPIAGFFFLYIFLLLAVTLGVASGGYD